MHEYAGFPLQVNLNICGHKILDAITHKVGKPIHILVAPGPKYDPLTKVTVIFASKMSQRTKITTTYEPEHVIQPIYTGGDVALDNGGRVLATCLGEEALLTNLNNGELLARIEGVCV